jgi:hypothetical protein
MNPAIEACAAKLRAGRLPTLLEFGALLREGHYEQSEARTMASAYSRALAGQQCSAEDELMASLRSFSLG